MCTNFFKQSRRGGEQTYTPHGHIFEWQQNNNVSWGKVTLTWTTQWAVFVLKSDTKHFQRTKTINTTAASTVHGSWTEARLYTWMWATAGKRGWGLNVLGLFRGLWSGLCGVTAPGPKVFTYWLMPCYHDGGNGRAIGSASNRATHLNTRGQKGSGTSIPSLPNCKAAYKSVCLVK